MDSPSSTSSQLVSSSTHTSPISATNFTPLHPPRPLQRPNIPRPAIIGPSTVLPPYPFYVSGLIQHGYNRGGRELGFPTANIPIDPNFPIASPNNPNLVAGVYYGWVGLDFHTPTQNSDSSSIYQRASQPSDDDYTVSVPNPIPKDLPDHLSGFIFPAVLSVGWNPFYANNHRSLEVHIMHHFDHDFYGAHIKLIICGFIRPEYNYPDLTCLRHDIAFDTRVALRCLNRSSYQALASSPWLSNFSSSSSPPPSHQTV